MTRRRHHYAAFTIVELLVATAVSAVLSGIIYTVGSEGLTAFARNISLNRSYSDARSTIERITKDVQSAGYTPILLDSNGVPTGSSAAAAGMRFYRYSVMPTYVIPSGDSSTSTLKINIVPGQAAPNLGDLVVISQTSFEGCITAISGALSAGVVNPDLPGTAPRVDTLTFATTINNSYSPAHTTTQNFAYVPRDATKSPPIEAVSFSCQIYTQVAYIAVPPTNGSASGATPLRYYPRAMSTGSGNAGGGSSSFNSATVFNNPANYKVIAYLPVGGTAAQLTPFQIAATNPPTLSVTLAAEGPDYNNRGLHTGNTFTQMHVSVGPRLPNQLLISTSSSTFLP